MSDVQQDVEVLDPAMPMTGAAAFGEASSSSDAEIIASATDDQSARVAELEDRCERLIGELAEVTAERDALKAAAEKVAAAPKAKAASALKKPRKIAPLVMKKDQDEANSLTSLDLLELIQSAGAVELAFSDGAHEISGIAALVISGDAWSARSNGLALVLPELLVHGPAQGQSAYGLAGYGLLLDGELVAYSARPEVLQIGAGMAVNLAADVIF